MRRVRTRDFMVHTLQVFKNVYSFECLVWPEVRQKIHRGTLSTACLIGISLTKSQTLPEKFMTTLSLINSTDLSMHIVPKLCNFIALHCTNIQRSRLQSSPLCNFSPF